MRFSPLIQNKANTGVSFFFEIDIVFLSVSEKIQAIF